MSSLDNLLNFDAPMDVGLFDRVVSEYSQGRSNKEAHDFLIKFQSDPRAWTRVDAILDQSQSQNSKILALTVLDNTIKSKWKALPQNQRDGIKNFVVNLIIKNSSDSQSLQANKLLLHKLNRSLVQIVKHEWPHNWPSFIPDLLNSSKASESLCANNMVILKELSEEIFDPNAEMTFKKMDSMKQSLNKEFAMIFELCQWVLNTSQDANLLSAALVALHKFLVWIPVGYIFETPLIETLALKFFREDRFQNNAFACLAEIGALNLNDHQKANDYNNKFIQMFCAVMEQVVKLITPQTNVAQLYRDGNENVKAYVRYLTNFITGFCKEHLSLAENTNNDTRTAVVMAHQMLLRISEVDDDVIFKICLEYWITLVKDLHTSRPQANQSVLLGRLHQNQKSSSPRLQMYASVLSPLRLVLISKMARPKEVLIVEDDDGELCKVSMQDTDALMLYKSMRECLVYLTHCDPHDTQEQMLRKLFKQVDDSEYSWKNLNTLCWAIGSISGSMAEDMEKTFLVDVIKDLLGLCEMKRGKEHKAVIASNIMYVVGQYPRFLRMHWKFLKTVVKKLFEFMHEKFPGVQDMAVETFLKITTRCRKKFVQLQHSEVRPFIEEIITELPQTIRDLEKSQIHVFYEACGKIIEAEVNPDKRQKLLTGLMDLPNREWTGIVATANNSLEKLFQHDAIKALIHVLKTNNCVAQGLGHAFSVQLARIYIEMLHVYKCYSEFISQQIQQFGPNVALTEKVKKPRAAKREILKLIRVFVKSARDSDKDAIRNNFLPPLLDPILGDYNRNVPEARESEVLSLFAEIFEQLGESVASAVPQVFEMVFQCTLEMITKNFEDFPDHRKKFFSLIRCVNSKCFKALTQIPPAQFKLVVDSIVWAFKHIERDVMDVGLETLFELLSQVDKAASSNEFFQSYLMSLMQELFSVLTDTLHKSGFHDQSRILAKMFQIVESGQITVPLWDVNSGPNFPNNAAFLRQHVCQLLANAFPNLGGQQTQQFVTGLFSSCGDLAAFKRHLRDFLVNIKEFGADGNDEMLRHEQDQQAAQRAQQAQQMAQQVPGLASPYQQQPPTQNGMH